MTEVQETAGRCDLLIRGGTLIDGSGSPGTLGDLAIDGARITAMGDLSGWRAEAEVSAAGLAVTPGFIDCHTHDDRIVLDDPTYAAKVSQGVTSVVAGNCGVSLAPFRYDGSLPPPMPLLGDGAAYAYPTLAAYRQDFERARPALNLAMLTGHGALRTEAMAGDVERPADPKEIEQMARRLCEALADGSLGLSTGLDYPFADQAPTEEIVALASAMAPAGNALYVSHIRNEGDAVIAALEEALEIGRRADRPVVISHHKCNGRKNFGRSRETLALIDAAAKKQRVALDVYPYTASSSSLLPSFLEAAEDVIVTHSEVYPAAQGRRLAEVAAELDLTEVAAAEYLYPAGAIYFSMDEADVERILAYPGSMVGSDGLPGTAHPHPRLWGAFPRVLGRYVRERGVLNLETAVHKMTGLPAKTFGLAGRGILGPGNMADVVLFDPETVIDRATFADPKQPAAGIALVLVAGSPVWRQGATTGERPGRFLARAAAS